MFARGGGHRYLLPLACVLAFAGASCSGWDQHQPKPIPDNEARPPLDNAPTWSPDGTRVVFARGIDETLRLLHVPSGRLTILADGIRYGGSALWSPDGQRLAYVRGSSVHVFDVRTGADRKLLDGVGGLGRRAWSPDGRLLAVASTRDGVRSKRCFVNDRPGADGLCTELYAVSVSGSEARGLTDNRTYDDNPVWSPDMRRLAVLTGHEPDDGNRHWRDVRVVSVSGVGGSLVTNDGRVERYVEWASPETLAIERDDGTRFELDLADRSRRPLESARDDDPRWVRSSLDGTLAFGATRDRNGRTCWEATGGSDGGPGCYQNAELYFRFRDGRELRVTHSRVDETDYAWSPDGRVLAFQSGGTLMLVDHDGTDLRRLLPRG